MAMAEYVRKSRGDDPHEDVQTTIAQHKKLLDEYAAKHRLPVVETYEEVVTGDSIFARPQMMRLLADVEQGKYEAVLVVDIDRLGRGGQKDQGIILETFKYSDTKIITLDKTYDLNNDMDEELAEFKTFFSRREYKMINKRLMRGLNETIKAGGYVANAPYGYVKKVIDKHPSLEINESEAEFIRMMFSMYADGVGCYSIAEELNRLGAHPHRSDHFGRSSVQRIITNPTYCGKIVWNRTKWLRRGQADGKVLRSYMPRDTWTIVQGVHEPIISEPLFDQVQEIYKGRYHAPTNTGAVHNPLAGLVFCAKCGGIIQRQLAHKKSGDFSYHRCITKGCACVSANSEILENFVVDQLHDMLDALILSLDKALPADTGSLAAALVLTSRALAKAESQKGKLYDLLEQGVYTPQVFSERSVAINEKIASLRERKQAQETTIYQVEQNSLEEKVRRLQSVLSAYGDANAEKRNSMLKQVVDRISYEKEKGSSSIGFTLDIKLKDVF